MGLGLILGAGVALNMAQRAGGQEFVRGGTPASEVGFPSQVPPPRAPAASAPAVEPPPYKTLRFEEDYGYLADPARRTDALDRFRYIPLLASDPTYYLSFGGELRERYEANHNPGFGLRVSDNDYLLQRITLSADLHLGPHLRVFVQGISGLQFFEDVPSPPVQDDRADLQMAFADFTFGDPAEAGGSFLLRLGRQQMSYGAGRLIATRAAPNIPFKFDGVTARWTTPAGTVSAFVVRPGKEAVHDFDGEDDTTLFWGLYGESTLPALPAIGVNAYYLGINRRDTPSFTGLARERNHTFGARVFGKGGGWDFDAEAIFQVGSYGDQRLLAWTLSNDGGYTFARLPWTPRLGLKADIASGDTDPHDHTLSTFDPLFFKSGYFNEASLYRPSNLMDVHPTLASQPTERLSLGVASDITWRYTVNDGVYGPSGNPILRPNGHGSHYLGTTLEASAEWKINRHLTVSGAYVYFFGGGYVKEAGGGDVGFFSATMTFLF